MADMQRIHHQYVAHTAHITLAHAPVNVIDISMMDELLAAIQEAEVKPEITAILFCGEGKCFSAGVDIAAHAPATIQEMLSKFHTIINAIANSQKVTIASVHGNCLGGGAELAMVCDIVYTELDATWSFPEIKLACYPPVACAVLAALVGQKRAAELILSGESISGSDAMLIGLATACGDPQDMEKITTRLLERLGKLSPSALRLAKKASYAWNAVHFDKALARAEKIYLEELMQTADMEEGINAWREKRQPKWSGK